MSLPETHPDLTQAKNWTPKTLATAVMNTLTNHTARAVSEALTRENAELNDFWTAEGKIKKVDFTSLVHYICTSGLLRKKTEAELSAILNALLVRMNIESEHSKKKKLEALTAMKEAEGVTETKGKSNPIYKVKPSTERESQTHQIQTIISRRITQTYRDFSRASKVVLAQKIAA